MTVYVDEAVWPYRGKMYCHMMADTLKELHDMADLIGLKRAWFQNPYPHDHPHYDLAPSKRSLAIQYGAVEITGKEMIRILVRSRRVNRVTV